MYSLLLPHITSNFLMVAMVIMVATVMVVMVVMLVMLVVVNMVVMVDRTGQDRTGSFHNSCNVFFFCDKKCFVIEHQLYVFG